MYEDFFTFQNAMIRGKLRKQNEFALAVDELIGDPADGFGVSYYFESLKHTFLRSCRCLKEEAEIFNKELQSEDTETKVSILKSNENTAYPLLETLYQSYFIVIHSELERIWLDITQEYNRRFKSLSFGKLASGYPKKPRCFIDEAVLEHRVILTYNYLRNCNVHVKNPNSKSSEQFKDVECGIRDGQFLDLKIIDTDKGFTFSIGSLQFGDQYAQLILNLMKNIVSKS